jgi:hypothetical protein
MDAIWVGEIEGEALVFDPEFQLPGAAHLFLWSVVDKEMGKYVADETRKYIKRMNNSAVASECIASYQVWRATQGEAWLQEEAPYYEARKRQEAAQEQKRIEAERVRVEAERISNLTPAERHKERLEKLGKEYLGVRKSNSSRPHRVTHCWACKQDLDNAVDIECIACNWILCSCGACGCGSVGRA